LLSDIKGPEGVMKKSKKRPTRDDLAATWKIIRDQSQIIKLQAVMIRRQSQVLGDHVDHLPSASSLKRKLAAFPL